MSEKEARSSNALMLLRKTTGAQPSMALVRAATGLEFSSSLTRMILKNIHTAFLTKKPQEIRVITNEGGPVQKDGEAPVMQMVRVAVKRYATTGRPNEWDESINWEPSSKKWAGGLQQSSKSKLPRQQFVYLEVPYDKWRNHYAKDKDGKYRGKLEPAENCILLPEDELKWRSGLPTDKETLEVQAEPLQRSNSNPEHYEESSRLSAELERAPEVTSEKEEAIFIEADGHAGLQMVDKSEVESLPQMSSDLPTSPTSPTSPISDESPTSPTSKKSWKNRIGRSRFSISRSSTEKISQ